MAENEIVKLKKEIDEEFAFALYIEKENEDEEHKRICLRLKIHSALNGGGFWGHSGLIKNIPINAPRNYPYAVANKIVALIMKLPPSERIGVIEKIDSPDYFGANIRQNKKPAV